MSEPARNRFALDLEDLERQLRGAAQAPRPGQASDPLAELTRIVGQDDPLKDLFAPRTSRPAAPATAPAAAAAPPVAPPAAWTDSRREPSFPAAPEAAPPAELRGALDEFEALLRRNDGGTPAKPQAAVYVPPAEPAYDDEPGPQSYARGPGQPVGEAGPRDLDQLAAHKHEQGYAQRQTHGQDGAYRQDQGYPQDGGYAQPNGYEPDPAYADAYGEGGQGEQGLGPEEDLPVLKPRRSRKGLWTAVGLIAVGVVGVGAAMTFRAPSVGSDGKPPVIAAETAPMKVEPVNPGGKEIPNQNKQIYERTAQAPQAETKVVSREEQPVDVQQAARSMPARVILPGPGTGAGETASNPLASAPGVPERLPTPSEPALTPVPPVPGLGEPRKVRTVSIRPDGTPAAPANGAAAAGIVTGSTPSPGAAATPGNAATQLAPVTRPRPPVAADAPKVQDRATTPAPAATTPAPPLRTANAAPAATTPAPAAAAPSATQAIRSGTGDFTVQLGAPGSEAEARATFAALQRKYPDVLGSQAPIIRKTDLAGGKTVYRLRIGPYSRENAATMCTQLQAAGGQCFISKN